MISTLLATELCSGLPLFSELWCVARKYKTDEESLGQQSCPRIGSLGVTEANYWNLGSTLAMAEVLDKTMNPP